MILSVNFSARKYMFAPKLNKGYVMEDGYVTYQNRAVPKAGFRVYIYAKSGDKKLVNSWEEFKRFIDTKDWFSTELEAKHAVQEENKQELFTIDELNEHDELNKPINIEVKRRGRKPKQGS
jgi:hypothetical protein